jgi:hypothetical protein
MSRLRILGTLALLAVVFSAPVASAAGNACAADLFAAADEDGIGGTGVVGDEDGIGGTGFDGEDGIGGTGVFGTITNLASICVNGLEIHYAPDVPLQKNGLGFDAAGLAPGQVVFATTRLRDGKRVARSISIWSALVGRVSGVDARARRLVVAGETVQLLDRAVVRGEPGGEFSFDVGVRVEIFGLRRPDGLLMASRVEDAGTAPARSSKLDAREWLDPGAPPSRLSVEGYPETHGPGRLAVNGVAVDDSALANRVQPAGIPIRVIGVLRDGTLIADRIDTHDGLSPPESAVDSPLQEAPPDTNRVRPHMDPAKPPGADAPSTRPTDVSGDPPPVWEEPPAPPEPPMPEPPMPLPPIAPPIEIDRFDVFDGPTRR